MKTYLSRFMSRLGYVPRPTPSTPITSRLVVEVDTSNVDAALAKIEHLNAAVKGAEAALDTLSSPALAEFIRAELVRDGAQAALAQEVRTLIAEVRADRTAHLRAANSLYRSNVATGGPASGLPG